MKNPRFSVATPTRNALEKLKRCVGSVRGQEKVSLQHIIQDANSTDGTGGWLIQQKDLISASEPDNGMYDAINRAWNLSNGEFLSWLNSDEQYLPGALAIVQDYFDTNPEVDIVFGNYIVVDSLGRPVALRREIPFRKIYVTNGFLSAQSCTIFFRRRLFEKKLLTLDSSYRYAADKDLILKLVENGAVIRHIERYLAVFGIDGTNLSTHPQMHAESEEIRLKYGAQKNLFIRKIIMLGRRVERLARGGYCKQNIQFQYALDEIPSYIEHTTFNLGGRYSLKDIEGTVHSARAVDNSK